MFTVKKFYPVPFICLLVLAVLSLGFSPAPSGTLPYGFDKKIMPSGKDFSKLLPMKVGSFTRVEFKAPQPGLDGEAKYRSGNDEIFMLFSVADTWNDLRETMKTIHTEIKNEKVTEPALISLKTNPAYIRFIGKTIAFFAWTRELYCFSADAKGGDKKVLDEFMNAFPY